jgi:hypothetical protein
MPRLRALFVGFASVGLFSVVLATAAPRLAQARVGGITVPLSKLVTANNADGTYTYTYPNPIAVARDAPVGVDEPRTPTCTASGATTGSVGLTSSTFKEGATIVSCAAPDDEADGSDTGTFRVTVLDQPLFTGQTTVHTGCCEDDLVPDSQTATAGTSDTVTFTLPVFPHHGL